MLEKLKDVLGKVLPDLDMSKVTEDAELINDLGFDSMAFIMLSMEIEDAFNINFEEFVQFNTVGDVCKYIESHAK